VCVDKSETRRRQTSDSREHHTKSRLREGDEAEVGLEEGKVIIKPITAIAQFKSELKGCVERSMITPLEAKKIWKA
jgi:hypothetical protein